MSRDVSSYKLSGRLILKGSTRKWRFSSGGGECEVAECGIRGSASVLHKCRMMSSGSDVMMIYGLLERCRILPIIYCNFYK